MAERSILAAVADDDFRHDVTAIARELADATGLRVAYAHVVQADAPAPSTIVPTAATWAGAPGAAYHEARRQALAAGHELLERAGATDRRDAYVGLGFPGIELQRIADDARAEAIVVGAPPGGALRSAARASATRVLTHRGDRPAVVARPDAAAYLATGPILCGIDPDDGEADRVAQAAARFAAMALRPLVVAYAGDFGARAGSRLSYDVLLHRARRAALRSVHGVIDGLPDGIEVEVELVRGDPARALEGLAEERNAALVVVGCRGRGALLGALAGSVSIELGRSSRRAVMIVPPGGDRA